VRERANEILEADGHPSLAHLTPHTLRRTFASILGVCRVDTRRAVALLGHTDARMTMGVYARCSSSATATSSCSNKIMGCTRDEARAIFESDPVLRASSERVAKKAPAPRRSKVMGA
jgi:hypothetical protein